MKGKLSAQPVIHVDSAFYIFGGYIRDSTPNTNVIARLDSRTYVWTQSGMINNARRHHNVVYVDSAFLVIGGYNDQFPTEKCQLSGDTMTCSTQNPTLDNYFQWPELILVEDDYCKELTSQ